MSARDRALLWLRRGLGDLSTPFRVDLAREHVAELSATHVGFDRELLREARAALASGERTREWHPAIGALAFLGEHADLALLRRAAARAPELASAAGVAAFEIRRRSR